jgi:peptidoglycan/LPS O-acetylase OafA/YrhL
MNHRWQARCVCNLPAEAAVILIQRGNSPIWFITQTSLSLIREPWEVEMRSDVGASVKGAVERLHSLDAVRGFALLLGVVFHAALAFLPGPQGWLVMEQSRSAAIAVMAFPLHMFRLTIFFLIAGFFARLLLERDGARRFAANRMKRIALPLVIFWPVVMAGIIAAMIWLGIKTAVPGQPAPPSPPFPTLPDFPLTHLWFLYALLLLYAGALVLRALLAAIDPNGRIAAGADRIVAAAVSTPVAPIVLALPLALAFTQIGAWPMWFGIPTPDQSLIPLLTPTIAYGFAFLVGWMLHRQIHLLQRWAAMWPAALVLALATTAGALALLGPTQIAKLPDEDWQTAVYYGCYAVGSWAWTIALIGLALRFLSGHSPARRYIADASYWVYVIHLPIVLAFQVAFSQAQLHWVVTFPAILGGSLFVSFLSYHWLVRRSFVGALLNGRRYRRAAPAVAPAPGDPSIGEGANP